MCVGAQSFSSEQSKTPGGVLLCPWRRLDQLERHLECDHSPGLFVFSGKKQLKMAMSQFEAAMYTDSHPGRHLHRTSLLPWEQALEGVTADKNAIDRHLRVVLDGDGPRLVSSRAAVTTERLRRVGSILYTRQFGERLLRELLLCHGGLRTSLCRNTRKACGALSRYLPWAVREGLVCRHDRDRVQTRRVPCPVRRWHCEDR